MPSKFQDRFAKSEKGIDIEMCCDALKLASASRVDRLFLLTNDGDFIPFCRTLKEFGANISIIHLSDVIAPNGDLLREVDSYDVVPFDQLQTMFLPAPPAGPAVVAPEAVTTAEKSVPVGADPETDSSKPSVRSQAQCQPSKPQ